MKNTQLEEIEYSIIIPTYDKRENLEKCLSRIEKLYEPKKGWEVLVINNAPTENTRNIVEHYESRIKNLYYYHTLKPGLMIGRHLGCEFSKGSILCFIDDDSLVTSGWLRSIEKAFSDSKVVLVGGPILPEYEVKPPKWLGAFWENNEYGKLNGYLSLIDFGEKVKEISPLYVWGCNFAIRKDIFLEIGGSHPDSMPKELQRFQGDGETAVSIKLKGLGYNALYHPDIKIEHIVPSSRMTLNYFCERSYFQGVCDSFTQIRKEHGLYMCHREDIYHRESPRLLFSKRLSQASIRIFRWVKQYLSSCKSKEIFQIKKKLRKCYEDGWTFHQRELKNDPALLKYVLRKNYLRVNSDIPKDDG